MVSQVKTITTLFLTLFLTCSPALTSAAALGNRNHNHNPRDAALIGPDCCFADSCLSWSLDGDGRTLRGVCYNKIDQRGHWPQVKSELDLSDCVGNFDGVLAGASAGAYSKSCVDCTLAGTLLTCKCRTPAGESEVNAAVDLNGFVQDDNGHLKCFDHGGQ